MQPLPHEVHAEIDEYEREEQQLAKQKKCMAILRSNRPIDPPGYWPNYCIYNSDVGKKLKKKGSLLALVTML